MQHQQLQFAMLQQSNCLLHDIQHSTNHLLMALQQAVSSLPQEMHQQSNSLVQSMEQQANTLLWKMQLRSYSLLGEMQQQSDRLLRSSGKFLQSHNKIESQYANIFQIQSKSLHMMQIIFSNAVCSFLVFKTFLL